MNGVISNSNTVLMIQQLEYSKFLKLDQKWTGLQREFTEINATKITHKFELIIIF